MVEIIGLVCVISFLFLLVLFIKATNKAAKKEDLPDFPGYDEENPPGFDKAGRWD